MYEYIVVSLILEDGNILAQAEAPAGCVSDTATIQYRFFVLFFFTSLIDFNEVAQLLEDV